MTGGGQAGEPSADDDDIGTLHPVRRRFQDSVFDGGGEAEVDESVFEEEGVGGADERAVLGADRLEGVVLCHPDGDVGAPPGEDVVADDDVIGLIGAADDVDDVRLDLLLGKGVHGESDGDGDHGLHVDLLGQIRHLPPPALRRRGVIVYLLLDDPVHEFLVVDAGFVGVGAKDTKAGDGGGGGYHLRELLLPAPPFLGGRFGELGFRALGRVWRVCDLVRVFIVRLRKVVSGLRLVALGLRLVVLGFRLVVLWLGFHGVEEELEGGGREVMSL